MLVGSYEMNGQILFYIFARSCCHCQEINRKHYIVVIKRWMHGNAEVVLSCQYPNKASRCDIDTIPTRGIFRYVMDI